MQKPYELLTDLGAGFVLHPTANVIEFESSDEARKSCVQLLNRRIEHPQAIGLSSDSRRKAE